MHPRVSTLILIVVVMLNSLVCHAEDAPSPELVAQGRNLFNTKEGLGVKYACIMCHKSDKAVKKSMLVKLGDKLPLTLNKYLVNKSKGKAIAEDSEQMKALMAYIQYEHAK
ncbi:MAG: hypothetical protein HYZ85_03180 [Candidatus Omnitrophica bacterium]|nr:hypothetical protein [Candidatus Omnitrophota bacterium]